MTTLSNKELVINALWIADRHAARIHKALDALGPIFPLTAESVDAISSEFIFLADSLLFRFAKLQDLLGNKLIDMFLEEKGELASEMSIIDKLHKLEKLGILRDSMLWMDMRALRNAVTHEYPGRPDITASQLNKTYALAQELLVFLDNIKAGLTSTSMQY